MGVPLQGASSIRAVYPSAQAQAARGGGHGPTTAELALLRESEFRAAASARLSSLWVRRLRQFFPPAIAEFLAVVIACARAASDSANGAARAGGRAGRGRSFYKARFEGAFRLRAAAAPRLLCVALAAMAPLGYPRLLLRASARAAWGGGGGGCDGCGCRHLPRAARRLHLTAPR